MRAVVENRRTFGAISPRCDRVLIELQQSPIGPLLFRDQQPVIDCLGARPRI
jgi:hypothetical protein